MLATLIRAALAYPYNKATFGALGHRTILHAGTRFYGRFNMFLADDVKVHAGTQLIAKERGSRIRIGSHSVIHRFCELNAFGGSIEMGRHCTVNQGCAIYGNGGVTMGSEVHIATGTVIAASNHVFDSVDSLIARQGMSAVGISIRDDVWIGANCCILDGVTIGSGCVVGAGAVVTRNLPELSIAVGVPARVISRRGAKQHTVLGVHRESRE